MPETRDRVFNRVTVDHLVAGSTRVSWSLFYQFLDPDPWLFTLQVGRAGTDDAGWIDVGDAAINTSYAIDDIRRDSGATRTTCYRVKLDTEAGTYYSRPTPTYGLLDLHDWLIAREIVRKERLRHRLATVPGILLKRRRSGTGPAEGLPAPAQTAVVDPLTRGIIARKGPIAVPTYGTDRDAGYYNPVAFPIDSSNPTFSDQLDVAMRGNVSPESFQNSGRAVLFPPLASRDVWVAADSDFRYSIGRIAVVAQWRGVPLVGTVELHQLPPDDIIYTIPAEI